MTWRGRFVTGGAVAMLVMLAVPVAPPATAASVITVPSSIDATGGRDVTQDLTALFASAGPGTTVRFPAGGRYRVDGVVFVSARHDIVIDGNGSTLVAPTDGAGTPVPRFNFRAHWPRLRAHLYVEDSTGVTIRNLAVQGPNAGGAFKALLEGQAGFVVARSNDVTLDHVTARATYGDGVYVIGHSTGVTIRDCTLDHNGRQGVAVVDGVDITVQRCTISSTGRSAIDLEPARGAARSVHVEDNQVRDATNFLLAAGGAGVNVGDVWLQRNHVTGGRGVSVYAGQKRFLRSGIHVLDNTGEGVSRGFDSTLLRFERFDGVEVKGNKQAVAKGVAPITLINSCHPDVSGNDFGGASQTPVVTGDCTALGLAPVTSSTSSPTPGRRGVNANARNAAQARRRAAARRRFPTPGSTTPVTVVHHDSGSSPVTIALAFVLGALAGGGVVALIPWLRNRSGSGAPPPERADPDGGPEAVSDDDADRRVP